MEVQLTVTLTGERPLLMHNGRLANPLDPYTRQLKSLTGKRKKTDDDLIEIMRVEARGGCWETDDGLIGLPNENVWRSIYDAAKAFKRGEDIKRALSAAQETAPLLVGGKKVACDKFLSDAQNIDYRSVRNQKNRVMRARPIVRDWKSTHVFTLLDDVMDARDLVPIFERAGRLVGVGDWRPNYGTFSLTVA